MGLYISTYARMCVHVCTFLALTEGTAAFILSGKEDRVQWSIREEQKLFEAPKYYINQIYWYFFYTIEHHIK